MSEVLNLSRRRFLKHSALTGGGLVLGVYLPSISRAAEDTQKTVPVKVAEPLTDKSGRFAPNAFVRIAPDDTVTVIVNHSEMGQGPTLACQ